MSELGNWQRAATALGFEIVAPFKLSSDLGTFEYSFLVKGFGDESGTLVFLGHQTAEQRAAATSSGFAYSSWLESNDPYVLDDIVEVLRDWGWAGSSPPPEWMA